MVFWWFSFSTAHKKDTETGDTHVMHSTCGFQHPFEKAKFKLVSLQWGMCCRQYLQAILTVRMALKQRPGNPWRFMGKVQGVGSFGRALLRRD